MLIINEHTKSQNAVIIKSGYDIRRWLLIFLCYNQPQYCALLCPKIAFCFKF